MSGTAELSDEARLKLVKIIAYEIFAWRNPPQLAEALGLYKYEIEHRAESNLLVRGIESNVVAKLEEVWAAGPTENPVFRLAKSLEQDPRFRDEAMKWSIGVSKAASWVVRVFASALGTVPWEWGESEESRDIQSAKSNSEQAHAKPDGSSLFAKNAKVMRTLKGHSGKVWQVDWSPDGQEIASVGEDGTVRIWHAADGQPIKTLLGHSGAAWRVAWSPLGDCVASGGEDGSVRIWQAVDGKLLRVLKAGNGSVSSIAWRHDGRSLAVGCNEMIPAGVTLGHVRMWHVKGIFAGCPWWRKIKPSMLVRAISWSPNGQLLAIAEQHVHIWNATNGVDIKELDQADSLCWSRDGQTLISGGALGIVGLHRVSAGSVVSSYSSLAPSLHITSLSSSPGNDSFAVSQSNRISLVSMLDGTSKQVLPGCGLTHVAWHPHQPILASAHKDGIIRIWRA